MINLLYTTICLVAALASPTNTINPVEVNVDTNTTDTIQTENVCKEDCEKTETTSNDAITFKEFVNEKDIDFKYLFKNKYLSPYPCGFSLVNRRNR